MVRLSTPVTDLEKVTVKSTLIAAFGFGFARTIDETVGAVPVVLVPVGVLVEV